MDIFFKKKEPLKLRAKFLCRQSGGFRTNTIYGTPKIPRETDFRLLNFIEFFYNTFKDFYPVM
jgi:hypothetical protein